MPCYADTLPLAEVKMSVHRSPGEAIRTLRFAFGQGTPKRRDQVAALPLPEFAARRNGTVLRLSLGPLNAASRGRKGIRVLGLHWRGCDEYTEAA